jgi:hypothetical protein
MEEKKSFALTLLGFLVLLVIATAFIPASWFGVKPIEKKYVKLNIPDADDLKVLAKDNNKDGVPDWRTLMQRTYQEAQITDQQSPDSKTNTLDNKTPVSQNDQARLNDPNNLTASFAKNIYVATAYMKEKGITDPQAQQDVFNNVLNQEATKIVIPLYTEKDLTVIKSENASSLKSYSLLIRQAAAQATKDNFGVGDTDAVNKYLSSKKPDDLKPLSAKVLKVDSLIKKLTAMPVPLSAVSIHLNILNRLSAYKVTLEGLAVTDSDSVRGTLAARQYDTTISLLYKAVARFDEYFKAVGVPLSMQINNPPVSLLHNTLFALYTNQ